MQAGAFGAMGEGARVADHYDGLSKNQLVALLRKKDAEKKLGLVWERDEIEADAAVDANFVACSIDRDLSDGAAPWRNLVIEGDNFGNYILEKANDSWH